VSQYDIIADCSDNFYTNYLIHDVCFSEGKPYVYASVSQFRGYCSVFNGRGPCLRCLFPTPTPEVSSTCNESGILGVVPGILGAIQATEVLKWILGVGQLLEEKLFIADLLKMTFREIQLSQNANCPLCVHNYSLQKLYYPSKQDHGLHLDNYAISITELRRLLKKPSVTLVDVRGIEEHEAHNIGGQSLPLPELAQRLPELHANHLIILYCQSGQRSIQALKILLESGFSSIKYLVGGISAIKKSELIHLI